MSLKGIKPTILFNIILIITFSISVNTFVELNIINLIFYILFHLTFIYYLFYHYNYLLYWISLFYGLFFDIFLLNSIGTHLLCFIILITTYVLLKKYLIFLSSKQITITIFITLIITLFSEMIFASILNSYKLIIFQFINNIMISIIIFFPTIFLLNKIDN